MCFTGSVPDYAPIRAAWGQLFGLARGVQHAPIRGRLGPVFCSLIESQHRERPARDIRVLSARPGDGGRAAWLLRNGAVTYSSHMQSRCAGPIIAHAPPRVISLLNPWKRRFPARHRGVWRVFQSTEPWGDGDPCVHCRSVKREGGSPGGPP
ncbi:unnamed protein product [Pleuronectes platessa]|uniref:Uncharacterized protein n=1 Tax=Pleuronectes platessa TaxID=8262 RepID=A0A9N7UVS5_PLEPL|nr:unnamed protein product [Pleuronectes platessa]